jgi:predicted amidohydrolase
MTTRDKTPVETMTRPESSNGEQEILRSSWRIGIVQYELKKIDSFQDFAQQCTVFARAAAEYKSDFVLFPELLTTQLLTFVDGQMPEAAVKVADYTDEYVALFKGLAQSARANIIAGSHLCLEEEKLYNVSYLFHRDGRIDRQYKLHITPFEKVWNVQPGNSVEVFDTDCGKVAILICYDIEFPELSRIAVGKGARMLFVPSNTDQRQGYLRVRYCSQARAIENQVYVALSGCTGNTPMAGTGDIHYAQSGIFTPSDIAFARDAVAVECAPNVETMVIQDVDFDVLKRNREAGSVKPWNDRRSDLYEVKYFGK